MKRLLKWMVILSVIGGAGGYVVYRWQRRAPGPLWERETDRQPGQPAAAETESTVPAEQPADPPATEAESGSIAPAPEAHGQEVGTLEEPAAVAAAPVARAWVSPPPTQPAPEVRVEVVPEPLLPPLESMGDELEAMVAEDEFLARPNQSGVAEEPEPANLAGTIDGAQAGASTEAETWIRDAISERSDSLPPVTRLEPAIPLDLPRPSDVVLPPAPPAPTVIIEPTRPRPVVIEPVRPEFESVLPDSIEEALESVRPLPVPAAPGRDAESYLDEGNVYFNVGQYGLAIERYTRALELDDSLTAGYYNRANARTRAGEYDPALSDYNRALELQPEDADALNNRGMLHLYRASYENALRDFNQALLADPSDTTVMVNRGLAHLHGGDPGAALVDFQEAAALDESDAAAHYGAGQAAAVLGNRDEAMKRLRRALQIDPAYAREAAADAKLSGLQGDSDFMRMLRDAAGRR